MKQPCGYDLSDDEKNTISPESKTTTTGDSVHPVSVRLFAEDPATAESDQSESPPSMLPSHPGPTTLWNLVPRPAHPNPPFPEFSPGSDATQTVRLDETQPQVRELQVEASRNADFQTGLLSLQTMFESTSAPYMLRTFLTIDHDHESLRHEAHIALLEEKIFQGADMLEGRMGEEGWAEGYFDVGMTSSVQEDAD